MAGNSFVPNTDSSPFRPCQRTRKPGQQDGAQDECERDEAVDGPTDTWADGLFSVTPIVKVPGRSRLTPRFTGWLPPNGFILQMTYGSLFKFRTVVILTHLYHSGNSIGELFPWPLPLLLFCCGTPSWMWQILATVMYSLFPGRPLPHRALRHHGRVRSWGRANAEGSVKPPYTVVIEDLNTKGMARRAKGTAEAPGRNVGQKSVLNREIPASNRDRLERHLSYPGGLVKVDPYIANLGGVPTHRQGEAQDSGIVPVYGLRTHGERRSVNQAGRAYGPVPRGPIAYRVSTIRYELQTVRCRTESDPARCSPVAGRIRVARRTNGW